jgi:hypothetical protein
LTDSTFSFVEMDEEDFPMHIEFIAQRTGEVVHTIEVEAAGVLVIPPLALTPGPIYVKITFPDGEMRDFITST